jgi:hypothetical protein
MFGLSRPLSTAEDGRSTRFVAWLTRPVKRQLERFVRPSAARVSSLPGDVSSLTKRGSLRLADTGGENARVPDSKI